MLLSILLIICVVFFLVSEHKSKQNADNQSVGCKDVPAGLPVAKQIAVFAP